MSKFFIQVKREFWECRASFLRTPFVMAGILMLLLLLGIVPFQNKIGGFLEHARMEHHSEAQQGTPIPEGLVNIPSSGPDLQYLIHGLAGLYSLFVLVLLLVLSFYFADALYADRRDQSILFWKSLPVAEHKTILAKLVAGTAGAPIFYAAAALATGAFYLLVISVYAKVFWNMPAPGLGTVLVTFLTSTVGLILGWWLLVIWYLPIFCWLLFTSAAARKAPFLIALGVPLALVILEAWVFGTGQLFSVLKDQIIAGLYHLHSVAHHPDSIGQNLMSTFSSVQLWIGLVVSAGFLVACAWLRHNRWEI
jgi:ABC-2 type transport system permease protein